VFLFSDGAEVAHENEAYPLVVRIPMIWKVAAAIDHRIRFVPWENLV